MIALATSIIAGATSCKDKLTGDKTDKPDETIIPIDPRAVDLGLSVKWANVNLGADEAGAPGQYFQWGYITPTSTGSAANYKYYSGGDTPPEKLSGIEQDAATSMWGSPWRMPTEDDFNELLNNCTWTPETIGDRKGFRVSGNGNSIFLPFGGALIEGFLMIDNSQGNFWTSTLYSASEAGHPSAMAWRFAISDNQKFLSEIDGHVGMSIRPVQP